MIIAAIICVAVVVALVIGFGHDAKQTPQQNQNEANNTAIFLVIAVIGFVLMLGFLSVSDSTVSNCSPGNPVCMAVDTVGINTID